MQGSRAKNEEVRQCHPYSGYHILHHYYNTGGPIFFFRQHDCGKHRNISFKLDMESCRYLYSYCNFGDCFGYNRTEDFGQMDVIGSDRIFKTQLSLAFVWSYQRL